MRVDYDNSKVVYSKVVDGSNPNCHIAIALKDNGKIVLDVIAIDESQVKENFDKIIEMYNEISEQVLIFKECPNCGIPAEHLQAEYHHHSLQIYLLPSANVPTLHLYSIVPVLNGSRTMCILFQAFYQDFLCSYMQA